MFLQDTANCLVQGAGKYNSIGSVQGCIMMGANVELQDGESWNALRSASFHGHLPIVKYLIEECRANVEAKHNDGSTALIMASQEGHLSVVQYLVQVGKANVNTTTNNGWSALHFSGLKGHFKIVQYLTRDCHADVTMATNHGSTVLHWASDAGHTNIVRYLIHECGADATTKDSLGWNALHYTSRNGHLDIVQYLIQECNVDVNMKSVDGSSALHIASQNGHFNVVTYLRNDCHADVTTTNMDGSTAYDVALSLGFNEIAKYLRIVPATNETKVPTLEPKQVASKYLIAAKNGNLNEVMECISTGINAEEEYESWSALRYASYNGHLEIVQYLTKQCHVKVEAKTELGTTALHCASRVGRLAIVEFLILDCYSNVEETNNDGMTALHIACQRGCLDVVKFLIVRSHANVETTDNRGNTVLHSSAMCGQMEMVRYLVEECCVDMTILNNDGETAYDIVSNIGNEPIASYLLQKSNNFETPTNVATPHVEPSTSYHDDINSGRQQSYDVVNETPANVTSPHVEPPISHSDDINPSNDLGIYDDRKRMEILIDDPTADPMVFSLKYLEVCTDNFTSKVLGEGAFGKVYFGCDKELGVQIAVKRITLQVPDQDTLDEITTSFKREIAVLKRFRHPNIVFMYGYNILVEQSSQFLVYEYLSNGSLAVFLKDEKGRIRIPSTVRLSIMFQLARSVHFLHTGGCDQLAVFHRDIKSGNICLTQDYTAKLIDCGLAKFVPDSTGNGFQGSVSPTMLKSSGAAVFGTPGYICPVYARGQSQYTSACDVFSIGVVFVELIVGCLQGGQSSGAGQRLGDFFSRYIRDEDEEPVENGWQILKQDSDTLAQWNDDVLVKLCKIAVQCMTASPKRRLSTLSLVETLSEATSHDFTVGDEIEIEVAGADSIIIQQLNLNETTHSFSDSYSNCVLCNRSTCNNVACFDGHSTCVQCIEQGIQVHLGKSGDSFRCKCGLLIHDSALFGKISLSTYNYYIRERSLQKIIEEKFDGMKLQLNRISSMSERNHDQVMTSLKGIESNIQRVLGGLAYVATNSVQQCPTVVWLVPSDRTAGNSAKAWKQWAKNLTHKKYDLYFICQHSFEVVETKMEITVPRSWLAQAAPALVLSVFLLKTALTVRGLPALPFPIPTLSRADQIYMNEDFVSDLLDDATMKLIDAFKAAYTQGSDLPYSESTQLLTLTGSSYEGTVAKATSMKRCHWKQSMEPVTNHRGSIIWIKNEYRDLY